MSAIVSRTFVISKDSVSPHNAVVRICIMAAEYLASTLSTRYLNDLYSFPSLQESLYQRLAPSHQEKVGIREKTLLPIRDPIKEVAQLVEYFIVWILSRMSASGASRGRRRPTATMRMGRGTMR